MNDILLPLRIIHRKLNIIKRRELLKRYLKSPRGRKLYVLGSPVYSNLGDSAILIAQINFLNKIGIESRRIKEITFSQYYNDRAIIKKDILGENLICGLGGGNMGNQWPIEEKFRYDMMDDFPNNPIVIFPQTVYFLPNSEQDEEQSIQYYNSRDNMTIVAREEKSFDIMKELYPNVNIILTPDIVLSATMETFGAVRQERNGILLCARNDKEKSVDNDVWIELEKHIDNLGLNHRRTDMYSECPITKENRDECVRKKMQEFCGAKLVITDRLHGMVFSAITGTPCIVFSNSNHKVKGTYDWISYLPYISYVDTAEQAKEAITKLLDMKDCFYDNEPLKPYFENLAKVVMKNVNGK